MAMRLAGTSLRPFNMTVTNVPGPQIPIYLLDAELEVQYPMVPLWTNHGLSIALFSYNGDVAWGVVVDSDTVHDLDRFMDYLDESFRELVHAARPRPARKKTARKKAAKKKSNGRSSANGRARRTLSKARAANRPTSGKKA
jgi:hypothetical protein